MTSRDRDLGRILANAHGERFRAFQPRSDRPEVSFQGSAGATREQHQERRVASASQGRPEGGERRGGRAGRGRKRPGTRYSVSAAFHLDDRRFPIHVANRGLGPHGRSRSRSGTGQGSELGPVVGKELLRSVPTVGGPTLRRQERINGITIPRPDGAFILKDDGLWVGDRSRPASRRAGGGGQHAGEYDGRSSRPGAWHANETES